jgi:hypothetical protein
MLPLKSGVASLVPVMLQDSVTGNPYKNVLYNNVQATVIKNDGTVVDLGTLGPTDWTEVTTGAFSQRGFYLLKIPASALSQEGNFAYGVSVTGARFYAGEVWIRANTEKDNYDRLGAPVGANISADIANVGVSAASGGFLSTDRDTLASILTKANLLPADPTSTTTIEAYILANTFGSSDRSNLQAIKNKTDLIGASVATAAEVTDARDNINTATGNLFTAIKGGAWAASDTLHQLRTDLATIIAKTNNLPTDPASQAAICGSGYDSATDSLHQLQLGLTGIVSGSGGFTAPDRAILNALSAVLPASTIAAVSDVASACDIILGVDGTYDGGGHRRTVSETYVYARAAKAKTDYIPNTGPVATLADVNAARDYLAGAGFVAGTDTLHEIQLALGAGNFGTTDRTTLNGLATSLAALTTTEDNNRTDIVAIRAKTDNLPSDPASNSHIDTVMGAGANAFTSEDHSAILDIQTYVHRLPADPASQSAGFGNSDRDVVSAIRAKTDLLPPDPASHTDLTALSNKIGTPHHTNIVGDMDYNLAASTASVDALSTKVGTPRTSSVVGDIGEAADLSLVGR